jgi:hypothetical protein
MYDHGTLNERQNPQLEFDDVLARQWYQKAVALGNVGGDLSHEEQTGVAVPQRWLECESCPDDDRCDQPDYANAHLITEHFNGPRSRHDRKEDEEGTTAASKKKCEGGRAYNKHFPVSIDPSQKVALTSSLGLYCLIPSNIYSLP